MNWIERLGLAALLLPALVACGGGQPGGGIQWKDGEVMAVAFLGYYDSFADFELSPSYAPLTRTFPQIVEAAQVDCGIGREIFLVIPRDPMATVAVNEYGEYITDENRSVFYRSEEGRPVLLLNNWYEDNSQVVCTDNAGHTVVYVPGIDDRTGALDTPSDGTVRNVSLPLPEPMEGYESFDYGVDFEDRDLGIRVRLQAGRPVLTCAAAPMANIGYPEESIVLADGDNEFSGINGLCKGVFLGTIGQDYNPVACVVMENGEIKMSSIFYAMQHGGPDLSEALPGFKDVTGFESGGGGSWVDEESGEDFYEYETIYALDARGGRTEIPYFVDYGEYRASDERFSYEATLTPDWHYNLVCYSKEDYSLTEIFRGSFSEKERGDSVNKFAFRRQYRSWAGDEDFETDHKPVSGTFLTAERRLSYEVVLNGSDAFSSGTLFTDERLIDAEDYDYD